VTKRIRLVASLVGLTLVTGVATAQVGPIRGDGTAGRLPLFDATHRIGNSTVSQNGNGGVTVSIATGSAVGGFTSSSTNGDSAVIGIASASSGITFGVQGISSSLQGVGVQGSSSNVAVAGFNQSCTPSPCLLVAGTAGEFVTGTGGTLLVGFVGPAGDPTSETSPVFRVDDTGKGFFDGGTQTSGADFAESVAVASGSAQYGPGDLLALDPTADRQLTLASRPYSKLIAGIYSTKPGVLATVHRLGSSAGQNEVPLAIIGIVPCKVSAENGAIHRGDLLVASSTRGYAMRGTDRNRMLGAVVGKAMEPLANGRGVIEVLVTLQ